MRITSHTLPFLLVASLFTAPVPAQLPDGYVQDFVVNIPQKGVGLTHDANGRMYVWTANGLVEVHIDDQMVNMLNIQEEVGHWGDLGMLGMALHPDFLENGYLYVFYTVDRHHLLYYGTPQYDPAANHYNAATIGRLTRYTADASTGFTTVDPASRWVMIGDAIDNGVPQVSTSHGTGALRFAPDGTLLVTSGDGASFFFTDSGQNGAGSFNNQALNDGIIRPEEAVGSFRSQMINCLNGKILRLDPDTGEGVPSNPFYDPEAPNATRSKVWTLGMRNPFRLSIRPGTGSTDPAAGDPGVLMVGDVGWNKWEELDVITEPGMNMGWPVFEGLTRQDDYTAALTENLDAPNPLFDGVTCTQEFFYFQDLIKQEREDHTPSFPNPCDSSVQISPSTPTFMHNRPCLEWHHSNIAAYVPTFENGLARRSRLGTVDCPVAGNSFKGASSTGGVFLSGLGFAAPYKGQYFFGDWTNNWIRALDFDHHHVLQEVLKFGNAITQPVLIEEDPSSGNLLYIGWSVSAVFMIRYTGDSNAPPQAVASAPSEFGPGPRTVHLDGTASFDPEGAKLDFLWEFEDGSTSTEPSPWRVFDNPGGLPAHEEVELTVTDPGGTTGGTHLHVHLDNTPPDVALTTVQNGDTYSTTADTTLQLDAQTTDSEHSAAELTYHWEVLLVHNSHEHLHEEFFTASAQTVLAATSCSSESYAYRVRLRVSDPEGLTGEATALLLPDCTGSGSVTITSPDPTDIIDPGDLVDVEATSTGSVSRVDVYVDGTQFIGTDYSRPYEFSWTPETPGPHILFGLGQIDGEGSVTSAGVEVDVRAPTRLEISVARVRDDAEENLITGSIVRNSRTLDLGLHKTIPTLTGLRMPVAIPQGAKIINAWVQFTCEDEDTGAARLVVSAEASDHAAPIKKAPKALSSRQRTTSSVAWKPQTWHYPGATGARQRTADLSQVIQEVVDRTGWQSGNHMLLLIEGFGQRRAQPFRPGQLDRPQLVVEYIP